MKRNDNQEKSQKAIELLTMYQRKGVDSPEAALRAAADLRRIFGSLGEQDAFDLVWSATQFSAKRKGGAP